MPQTTTVAEEDDWAGDIIAMLSLPQAGVAVDTAEVCAPRQGHSNTVYSQTPPDAEKENKQPTSVDVDVPFGVPHASTVVHQVQGENSVDWKTDGKGKGKGGEENEAEEQEDVVHPDALVSLFTTEILFPNGRKPLSKTSSAANEMASLPSYEPGPAAVPLMKKRPRVSDEDLQPVGAPQARAAPRTRAPKAKPPAVQATCLWAGCGKTFMTNAPATTLAHLKTHGEDVALLNAQGYLRCRWPGCIGRRVDDNGPGRFSSTAAWSRHVHSIHIMGKKLCPHGCGKLVGRGDAVKRHNERHHPELLKKARIEG
ncbi:hypothetical protein OE88DRAFT_1738769 [Heliocybe sulcata]|uniref:C2H2-type domain-containing protein n=1 Tax=Heliocybe sulcata TaxID=5364 RepID=A0A5C3MTG7_9AGAM|nr:hypothetical protein OE88DRAFT_1738769 [Heliocybe sulcata]